MRRPREVIERLPGPGAGNSSFVIDVEGNKSIEDARTLAGILLRIWPDLCLQIAIAWRPVGQEETVE